MNKISLKIFCDGLFILFVSFSVSFVFLNFIIVKPFSIIISICVGIIFSLLYAKYSYKKTKKFILKREDEKKIDEMLGELNIMKKQKLLGLFLKAFNKNHIFVTRRNGGLYSPKEKTLFIFHFGFSLFDKNDVVSVINKLNKGERAVVFTHQIKDSVISFANKFSPKIEFKLEKETFMFLSRVDLLPQKTIDTKESGSFFYRLKGGMIKKRAPKIFAFGLFFLISSFFVTYKVYYAIVGSLFLISSLIITLLGGKTEN